MKKQYVTPELKSRYLALYEVILGGESGLPGVPGPDVDIIYDPDLD